MAFYGRMPPRSVRVWVLEHDGQVLGLAGYFMQDGKAVLFSDVREGVPKMTIWRAALAFMKSLDMPLVCEGTQKSAAFLERLGWVYVGDNDNGMVFEWRR